MLAFLAERYRFSDAELVGIVAHEIGYVHHRHGTQMLIQGSLLALLAAVWFGDVASIAAGIPVLLLQNGYSRDSEREADRYALTLLSKAGISVLPFADILERLEQEHGESGALDRYISTHPATQDRIEMIRAEAIRQ